MGVSIRNYDGWMAEDLGEIEPEEWSRKAKEYQNLWKEFKQTYKGKKLCVHNWAEPPPSLKIPPSSISATIVYPNGARKPVTIFLVRTLQVEMVELCVNCNKLHFYYGYKHTVFP